MKLLYLIPFGFLAGAYAAAIGDINNSTEHLEEVDDWVHDKVVAGDFVFTRKHSPKLVARIGMQDCPANRRWGDSCVPYKCQCKEDLGCWSCNGNRYRCQPGPARTPRVCLTNDD